MAASAFGLSLVAGRRAHPDSPPPAKLPRVRTSQETKERGSKCPWINPELAGDLYVRRGGTHVRLSGDIGEYGGAP